MLPGCTGVSACWLLFPRELYAWLYRRHSGWAGGEKDWGVRGENLEGYRGPEGDGALPGFPPAALPCLPAAPDRFLFLTSLACLVG